MNHLTLFSILFNPLKPGQQSSALCGVVCALLIANGTFIIGSIVSLLILAFNFEYFHYITICFMTHKYHEWVLMCFIYPS